MANIVTGRYNGVIILMSPVVHYYFLAVSSSWGSTAPGADASPEESQHRETGVLSWAAQTKLIQNIVIPPRDVISGIISRYIYYYIRVQSTTLFPLFFY